MEVLLTVFFFAVLHKPVGKQEDGYVLKVQNGEGVRARVQSEYADAACA